MIIKRISNPQKYFKMLYVSDFVIPFEFFSPPLSFNIPLPSHEMKFNFNHNFMSNALSYI